MKAILITLNVRDRFICTYNFPNVQQNLDRTETFEKSIPTEDNSSRESAEIVYPPANNI